MNLPAPALLYEVVDATWPAVSRAAVGPWCIRNGAGGGKRASAATAEAPFVESDIDIAERAMARLSQHPLFMIRDGETTLDSMLDARGYQVVDPVTLFAAPLSALLGQDAPRITGFAMWPPLAIIEDIWMDGGIGPARQAVMARVVGPKAALLGRTRLRAAGSAFVAIHADIAMIHAIEVDVSLRRQGAGRNIMRLAARWAQDQGATHLTLAVTDANAAAIGLYSGLGLSPVRRYHYRVAASGGRQQ